jgi:hypothetical protein
MQLWNVYALIFEFLRKALNTMTKRPKLGHPCDILYILKLFHFIGWFYSSIVQEEPESKCW